MRPRRFTDPNYVRAFREIVARLGRAVRPGPGAAAAGRVQMYVAGGAALHFYTGARISGDVDAAFSHRIIAGDDLEVSYADARGDPRLLYFDKQYNETFALVHAEAHEDSLPLAVPGLAREPIEVRLFSPLDLAVSKLARFAEHDRDDIRALALAGLIEPRALRRRAGEALSRYVGDPRPIRNSIDLACEIVRKARRAVRNRPAGRRARSTSENLAR